MTTTPVLTLSGVSKSYGSVCAVDAVDMEVDAGERRAVIGPNGAGKSTLFAMMAGTLRPTSGSIRFDGADITRVPVHKRARRGLVKTFQHSSLFESMTVMDNVVLAAARRTGGPGRPWGGATRAAREAASSALTKVGLIDRSRAMARHLSHGERRQLELALALSLQPRVLMLDEPTAGMSAGETGRFVGLVAALSRDTTILVIEHDLEVVFSLADRVTVLHLGAVLADGSPDEIRDSDIVQRTYLGAATAADATPGQGNEVGAP